MQILHITVTVKIAREKFSYGENVAMKEIEIVIPQNSIGNIQFGNIVEKQVFIVAQQFLEKENLEKKE